MKFLTDISQEIEKINKKIMLFRKKVILMMFFLNFVNTVWKSQTPWIRSKQRVWPKHDIASLLLQKII